MITKTTNLIFGYSIYTIAIKYPHSLVALYCAVVLLWFTSVSHVFYQHDDVIKMESFSALLAICAGNSPVAGEFPAQRPVTLSFDVFFDLRLNKRLCEQSWGWWFETPSHPLWRHRNAYGQKLLYCQSLRTLCVRRNISSHMRLLLCRHDTL